MGVLNEKRCNGYFNALSVSDVYVPSSFKYMCGRLK